MHADYAASRGDVSDSTATDPIDGDVRVPLLHASQPSNLILEYYTNTRFPRALGSKGLSAARAVANPQHPTQELIEALNRNIDIRLHGYTRDVTLTSHCVDDREQEYRKLKDTVLRHLSDVTDGDQEQELPLAQHYQHLYIEEENHDHRPEDDAEIRHTLGEGLVSQCNGMQSNNETLPSSITITSMLSHLTSENAQLNSHGLTSIQRCAPESSEIVRINGDQSSPSCVTYQALGSEDQNSKHELGLESEKTVKEFVGDGKK